MEGECWIFCTLLFKTFIEGTVQHLCMNSIHLSLVCCTSSFSVCQAVELMSCLMSVLVCVCVCVLMFFNVFLCAWLCVSCVMGFCVCLFGVCVCVLMFVCVRRRWGVCVCVCVCVC